MTETTTEPQGREKRPFFYLARICLESITPLSIGSGVATVGNNMPLVRDANNLPTLPATSIVGVMRHLYQKAYGKEETETLFGYQRTEAKTYDETGHPSRVECSWGMVHDQNNRPVEKLIFIEEIDKDPLLSFLKQTPPILRDHVRLNHRGVAADKAKFDRSTLPPGCRFSFELSYWSDQEDDPKWHHLLSLFILPQFRLGGGTRSGLGAFKLIPHGEGTTGIWHAQYDLRESEAFKAFAKHSNQSLDDYQGLKPFTPQQKNDQQITLSLTLKPDDYWRFGQGNRSLLDKKSAHQPDMLPLITPVILWKEGLGEVDEENLLIPGSAIKGAFSHRLTFHYLRKTGQFLENLLDDERLEDKKRKNKISEEERLNNHKPRAEAALGELLGYTGDDLYEKPVDDESHAQVGRLLINDRYIPLNRETIDHMMHNSVDRFTGGVRDGMLFCEELVFKEKISIEIRFLRDEKVSLNDENLRWAIGETIKDLCEGRMALGAASGRGHGYFTAESVRWSDGGKWIEMEMSDGTV
ncbi:RAMP superfamily CRISPR-associated protein [Magnetococcales bacterium HHB-1]